MFFLLSLVLLFACVGAQDPSLRIIEPPAGQDAIAELKRRAYLTCVVENRPLEGGLASVKWFKKNSAGAIVYASCEDCNVITSDLRSYDAVSYSVEQPSGSQNEFRLVIKDVKTTDEGYYMCRMRLNKDAYLYHTKKLIVIDKPQIVDLITSSDTDVDIRDGKPKDLKLDCGAAGRPTPKIFWDRIDGASLEIGGYTTSQTDGRLLITNVNPEARGMYKCSAVSRYGEQSRTIKVSVQFAPIITIRSGDVHQAVGYKQELICEAESSPELAASQIWWRLGADELVEDGNGRKLYFTQNANNKVTLRLTIDVKESDFADGDRRQFTCVANNGVRRSKAIFLIKSDKPVVLQTLNKVISKSPDIPTSSCLLLTLLLVVTRALAARATTATKTASLRV